MSGVVEHHFLLRTWIEKEWTSLNFDSRDVFDVKKHKDLMKIFTDTSKGKDIGQDGRTLFAERIATLSVKDINKTQQESLRKFFHLLKDADEERFMIAYIPLNKDCPTFTDDKLFSSLV